MEEINNEDLPFQEGQDNGSITIHSLNEYISNSNVNQAINQIKQAEQQAISNFSSQKVSPEMLSESTKQLINASGGGTITNLADDEDIESVGQDLKVLKFADRAYNPDRFSGKGYKIFRRNIIDGKNILTQEMINQPDTIYEIRYDFDLDGAEISIPEGCILKFNGGRFLNALNIKGNVENKYLMPEWFGASNDGKTDSSDAFNAIVRICRSIRCSNKKTYLFTKDIDAKILNELSIDMNMSSFIDFHIVINMNDGINDWRSAYSSIGLSIKEGFIMSKGSDTKYRNWQIPVIISGVPVHLDNMNIRRVPYKTLYPHFFYNQGVLVSTSGNLKSPLTDFLAIPYLNVGVTSQRPGNADNGFQFFDMTLRKPIWWNGSSWVDANGATV